MLGWFREESRLAEVLLDEIGWETMTHCLTLTGWEWRGRWRRGGRRERGQLYLADWRRGGRRERGQLCLADWRRGGRRERGKLCLADWRRSAWAGNLERGGGRGEGRRRFPSDRVTPSAQACFASFTDERDASNRPAPTFTLQVDSELPVRPGDQLQLMLVEAKQGGDAGPPRFTVTGHFALNEEEEEEEVEAA